eukprot:Phypoly_transcript_05716.p1 GENE.Phypoly_transcript_05716~~Phypoly_transcript_05716.p1  ORF type:complete len:394 (+),score=22.60 Phypoly_transcript_05716:688-1869(+)
MAMDSNVSWQVFLSFFEEKSLLGCVISTAKEKSGHITENGFVENHTYAILNYVEEGGKQYLVLRNPWGRKGSIGDKDQSRKESSTDTSKNGRFRIPFDEFVKHFNELFILRTSYGQAKHIIHGTWTRKSGKGSHGHPKWHCNPRYVIKTHEPNTNVLVNLSQCDLRKCFSLNAGEIRDQGDYESIGIYLFEKSDQDYKAMQYRDVLLPTFTNTRDTSLEFTAKPSSTYVLQPSTLLPMAGISFVLSVYANFDLHVAEIRTEESYTEVGEWPQGFNSRKSQGPRYVVQCLQDSNVDVLLATTVTMHLGISVASDMLGEADDAYICISFRALKGVEYIIEPRALSPTQTTTSFELMVFSDNISKFSPYVAPTHSHNAHCNICSLHASNGLSTSKG